MSTAPPTTLAPTTLVPTTSFTNIEDAIECPVSVTLTNDVTYPWTGLNSVTKSRDGIDVGRSGQPGDNGTSSLDFTVPANSILHLYARTSSETTDKLFIKFHGFAKETIGGGDQASWTKVSVITDGSTGTLEADYTKDISISQYDDRAYIDNVSIESTTINDVVSETAGDLTFSHDLTGNNVWYPDETTVRTGTYSMVSGDIGDSESTTLKATVQGPGDLSFYWKVSSESGWDKLTVLVDDVEDSNISGAVDWTLKSINLPNAQSYTIKWTYSKDGSGKVGSDCGWIDDVSFSFTGTTAAPTTTLTTEAPTTAASTTLAPTTSAPTTLAPTTLPPTLPPEAINELELISTISNGMGLDGSIR